MFAPEKQLNGRIILITRSEGQSDITSADIVSRGGKPLYLPCLEMECLGDSIRQSIPLLEQKKGDVLFTSRNGVACVAATLGERFTSLLSHHRVTAVGEKTAAALQQQGIYATLQAETASQAGLIETYREHGIPEHILFYRAQEGSNELADALSSAGCDITTIHAYRMSCPKTDASEIIEQLEHHRIDGVLLGSSKTVHHYIRRIGNIKTANTPAIAVISHQVAEAAEAAGLSVQAVAKTASFDAMLDSLADYFNDSGAENHVSS